jgi:hypothetical protein
MKLTRDTYDERVAEINFYYDALGQLADETSQSLGNFVEPIEKYKHDGFLKILKPML